MSPVKVHIIHVGNMNNKGTQALFLTDISLIRQIFKDNVIFSVSTVDVEKVSKLASLYKLPLNAIVKPVVDVPYEKMDSFCQKYVLSRKSIKYKFFSLFYLVYMFAQLLITAISTMLAKIGFMPMYRSADFMNLKACDVVISCSDENFKEISSMIPPNFYWIFTWWSLLISRMAEVVVAKCFGKKLILFPNSIGPFKSFFAKSLAKFTLNNYSCVIAREPYSFEIAKSLKLRSPVYITSDTALLFSSTDYPVKNLRCYGDYLIGVSPGFYSHSFSKKLIFAHTKVFASVFDSIIERYGFFIVFLPHYTNKLGGDDLEICRLILREMKRSDRAIIVESKNVSEFKALIAQMNIIISSKLHPAVLAAGSFIPALCIAYDFKQTGFFKSLHLDECVIPIHLFSSKLLLSKIEYVWTNQNIIKTILEQRVPELQASIKNLIEIILFQLVDTVDSSL